ncbi:hypothetical protein ACFWTE_19190 [Nocardiopsis sp. NPDC058631]|uniref:hypothetical protein n=1 Tax=Nocardiopsis sp. NPDC058631 TaxID=3346566 RepID=UPI00365DE75B
MPSIPHTSGSETPHEEGGERPNWLVSVLVVVACLAVIASGWGVARLTVGSPLRPLEIADGPESRPPRTGFSTSGADPEDAESYVAGAAALVEDSSAFHVTFTVHDGAPALEGPQSPDDRADPAEQEAQGGQEAPEVPEQERREPGGVPVSGGLSEGGRSVGTPTFDGTPSGAAVYPDVAAGRGRVMYDATAEPEFDHFFTTLEGQSVYRYDVGDGQLMMTADRGLKLLDPPTEADGYLCSRGFGSAKLHEILDTGSDLSLVGSEEVELRWPGQRSSHSAYLYTGTFSGKVGGYDTDSGANTLTLVRDARFELWIDEQGYPRRLDYRTPEGFGETYEYHSFS